MESRNTPFTKPIALALIACLSFMGSAAAAIYQKVPNKADPEKKYLFYMHGAWVEIHGLNRLHPRHGPYRYEEILRVFSQKGFEVISEIRSQGVPQGWYADKTVGQIRLLLGRGIPGSHITVTGHSKGGQISLIVASRLGEPEVNYVIMAGCGKMGSSFRKTYEKFLRSSSQTLLGRILSIYDSADPEAGSCREALNRVLKGETKEVILHTGRGHGLFYSPESVWMDLISDWSP